jgi:hypothetical protein
MIRNRLLAETETVRLPRPPAPEASPAGFMLCPPALGAALDPVQWLCQQALYRWAFEQAQAVVRPSLPERDLLGVWN